MPRSKTKLVRHDYSFATSLAAEGHTEASIAKAIKVSPRLFRDLKKEDPKLADALAVGKALLANEMVSLIKQRAQDGDLRAMEVLLNRSDPIEKEPQAVAAVGINITLPDSVSPEAWTKLIDVTPKGGDDD